MYGVIRKSCPEQKKKRHVVWSNLKLGGHRKHVENLLQSSRKISSNSKFPYHTGSRIWRSSQYTTPRFITIKLQHLETNLHRLSSPVNILIFVKSNSKLHFFGPLSRYVRTLIVNISSSKVPTNKVHIHSVRNVCKLVIIFHLSWQDLSRNVDHPFKNPTPRVRVQTNGAELKYSIHLAHAQTKCPYAEVDRIVLLRFFILDAAKTSPQTQNICPLFVCRMKRNMKWAETLQTFRKQ